MGRFVFRLAFGWAAGR